MSLSRRYASAVLGLVILMLSGCGLSYQNRGSATPPREPLPGPVQPSLAALRTPLSAEVVDRRFRTREAMFLANEMNETGFPFFERAAANGVPGLDPIFVWLTTVESYWYSRYNMSALVSESRLGIHTVYGPYVSELALQEGRHTLNRDRGEYVRSNASIMLQDLVPMYQARTGFPRRFEEASPLMLTFASGDPHYPRALDTGTMFESEENMIRQRDLRQLYGDDLPASDIGMGKAGNDMWKARVNYRENFLSLRWDHGKMEHTIDLGAEGQVLVKQALWMEHFFQQNHHQGRFLGNNPEQGFRGAMLSLMAVNKMLMLKSALLTDGKRLLGVDPREANPGETYFPHRVSVRMRQIGDLPPRPESFALTDASSQLFDQASLLWGVTEYYHFADPRGTGPWAQVVGNNPPYDGSIMEQKYVVLAEGLADMIVANLGAMHADASGVLSSEWKPGNGRGALVSTGDLGLAMVALANYVQRLPATAAQAEAARALLVAQADFVQSTLLRSDGSVATTYDLARRARVDAAPTLLAQAMAIRGLLAAAAALDDARYETAAHVAYAFMNQQLWDEATGVYRSHLAAEVSEYTPLNLGAALGAMREMILVTKNADEMDRFKRFWVQAVDGSGIQQSEYEETGERDVLAADMDHDGIPRMNFAGGAHGIAPVFASRVLIQTPTGSRAVASKDRTSP